MRALQSTPVIITGASEGIGRALALAFARRGHSVGLLARRGGHLDAVAAQCREEARRRGFEITALTAACDVCDSGGQREALARLDGGLGGVGIFIANAGVNGENSARVFAVNVLGAVDGIEFMRDLMVARGGGRIVGVGSIAGVRGLPQSAPYSASKAALHAYLEALRLDLASAGVGVSVIAPGFIDTAMTRGNENPQPFMITADVAAERMAGAILRGRALIIEPRPFWLVYFALKHMPDWVYRRLVGPWFGRLKG